MEEDRMTVEEKVQSLLEMGFCDEANVRKQLTRAKNDLSVAVAYLTDDDGSWAVPQPIQSKPALSATSETTSAPISSDNITEYPETHLYDLIDRASGQNTWTIPYQRHESFGVLLNATTQFLERGQFEGTASMDQFLFQVLPDCIEKLTMSTAVSGWKEDVVTGVFDMLIMTVELVASYAAHRVLPSEISKILVNILDKNNKFHNNSNVRHQKINKQFVQQQMNNNWITPAPSSAFSLNLSSNSNREVSGWLIDLVNHFAVKKGFESLAAYISPESDYASLANCLAPFSVLADVLMPRFIGDLLSKRMTATFQMIASCDEATLKSSSVTHVFDVLRHLHKLFQAVDTAQVETIENCYFELLLRMVSLQNFGTRMNALKQVLSLFDAATKQYVGKPMFSKDALITWLNKSSFLTHAMSSNLDHAQYCEKLGKVLENMGAAVSKAHLKAVCDHLRSATNDQATENITNLLTQIIPRSGAEKLREFLKFLQEAWSTSDDWSRAKILRLFDKVASSTRFLEADFYQSIVDCVWNLAMTEAANGLVSQIMETHLQMIREPGHNRLAIWRLYASRCYQNMTTGTLVYLSARHLLSIVKPSSSNYYPKEVRTVLKELEDKDIVEAVLTIIDNCVGRGADKFLATGAPDESQLVSVMLDLIRQISTNSDNYISLESLGRLWTSLVDRDSVSPSARNHIFKWLRDCIKDSKAETKRNFFTNYVMRSMSRLCSVPSDDMVECFKEFFIHCNITESNIVENIDKSHYVQRPGLLVGIECVWFAALTSRDDAMASKWSSMVIDFLVVKLQPTLLHETNIGALRLSVVHKCLSLLLEWLPEDALIPTIRRNLVSSEKALAEMITELAPTTPWLMQDKLGKASGVDTISFHTQDDEVAQLQLRRALEFIAYFVASVDSRYQNIRLHPSHQISFVGAPVTIHCMPGSEDSNQSAFDIHTHSNELFGVVRSLIAKQLETTSSSVEARFVDSGRAILPEKDTCLLQSLGIGTSNVVLKVKKCIVANPFSRYPSISSNLSSLPLTSPSPLDERLLVGVGLSKIGYFYQFLYQLLTENDRRVSSTSMRLLQLLPTDPTVSAILTNLPSHFVTSPPPGISQGTPTYSLSSLSIGAASPSKHSCPSFFSESSLESLLSADSQPPLLLLYNLQALSANLMPVSSAMAPVATTEPVSSAPSSVITPSESQTRFCSLFIQFDGLLRLAELLYHPKLITSEDVMAKQESFRLVLRLMKHLLQHATTQEEQMGTHNEMDFASSPPASASSSSSSLHSTLVKNRPNLVSLSPRARVPISSLAAAVRTSSFGFEAIQSQQMFESLIRLCWTTTSGKLHVTSPTDPTALPMFSLPSDSTSTSSSSDQSLTNTPTPGGNSSSTPRRFTFSGEEQSLTTTDVELAKESLELICMLMGTRPVLYNWFCPQQFAGDFLTAILVSCPSSTIRQLSRRELFHFASNSPFSSETLSYQHPTIFLIEKLLQARVPFWSSSSIRRGPSQRLVSQCSDYFDLLADLIRNLSSKQHVLANMNPPPFDALQQIKYEIKWLDSFTTSSDDPFMRLQRLDDLLLAGHLGLMSAWLSFLTRTDHASTIGRELIPYAFDSCLVLSRRFFAPFKTQEKTMVLNIPSGEIVTAKCSGHRARQATLDLIVSLAAASSNNVQAIADRLSDAYTILPLEMVMEHFRQPVIPPKSSPGGFVGLKNAGATCYMNAVIQQLFMIPKLSDALMSISVPSSSGADNRSLQLVFELQKIFAYLSKSFQQYYIPEGFWRNFGFTSGSGVNVREHQDAFDFFTTLVDTVDEALKKAGQQPVLAPFFRGLFVDEKTCDGCPHRFRTDCPFFSLSLPVASGSLEQSLQQYVKSERLDGENSYFCEKCQAKRAAVKRLALKQLPPVLCIQLKRFYYDWERGVPQKFDSHFTFPWTLDIEPFTEEGISRQDSTSGISNSSNQGFAVPMAMDTSSKNDCDASSSSTESGTSSTYQLVGIVVHSGQSNAGHYYSLIRDRRQDGVLNPNHGRWFNFNDTEVKEFALDDSNIEHECFGGTYQATEGQSVVNYSGERIRSWSAYLLFYEHVEAPSATARYAKRTRMSETVNNYLHFPLAPAQSSLEPSMSCRVAAQRLDSLAELSLLLQQGERHGLFGGTIPAHLSQQITESNALSSWFLHLHDDSFAEFVEHFVQAVIDRLTVKDVETSDIFKAVDSTTHMLTTFLFSILLPAFPSAINDKRLGEFVKTYTTFIRYSKTTALSGISWLSSTVLAYTKMYLLDNLEDTVRRTFREIVSASVNAYFTYFSEMPHALKFYFSSLIRLLPDPSLQNAVVGSPTSANSQFAISMAEHFFHLLYLFISSSSAALTHAIVEMEALNRLLSYLFMLTGNGQQQQSDRMNDVEGEIGIVALWQDSAPPINAASATVYRQNGPSCDYLHRCIALLLCGCDLSSTKTEYSIHSPIDHVADLGLSDLPLADHKPVPLPQAVRTLLPLYISEVVAFSCEIDTGVGASQLLESAFVHLCTGAVHLSTIALQCLLTATAKAPTSHLRPVVALLHGLLRCGDSLHGKRVQTALDGFQGAPGIPGLLDLINEFRSVEGRRAYQAMKIICEVSTFSEAAKQLVAEREACWSGAVDWLNEVLSGSGTAPSSGNVSTPMSPQQTPTVRTSTETASGTSPVTKSFARTESACSTLKIARDLLRPASSDTSSTVTQLIDSPPEQDSSAFDSNNNNNNNRSTIIEELQSPSNCSPSPPPHPGPQNSSTPSRNSTNSSSSQFVQ